MSNNRLGGINSFLDRERSLAVKLTVFFALLMLVLCVTGITIWPAILAFAGKPTSLGVLCNALKVANVILLAVYVVLTTLLVWFDNGYTFLRNFIMNASIGWVVNFCVLMFNNAFAQTELTSGMMIKLLWFTLSVLLGMVVSIVPAAIVAGIAKALHAGANFYNRNAG